MNGNFKVEVAGDAPDIDGNKVVAVRVFGNSDSVGGVTLDVRIEEVR